MIIFYRKDTGEIVGTLNGRVHSEQQKNTTIEPVEEVDKLIVEWVPVRYYDTQGNPVSKDSKHVYTADYEANHAQKEIFSLLDTSPMRAYDYRVDPIQKLLVPK